MVGATPPARIVSKKLFIRNGLDHFINNTGNMMFWNHSLDIKNGKTLAIVVRLEGWSQSSFRYRYS